MKTHALTTANALALTALVGWTICSLFVVIFPDVSLVATRAMLHGRMFAGTGPLRVTLDGFLLAGAVIVGYAWVLGYVFSTIFATLQKKK